MDLGDIPIFQAMKRQMKHLMAERKVISENIANADTPGYVAKQLDSPDFSAIVASLDQQNSRAAAGARPTRMAATKAGHVSGAMSGGNARESEVDKYEVNPDGNSVVLEEEMIRAADNQMQYDLVTQLYKKNLTLLKAAIKAPGSR